eukprot:SAG31_NODE_3478_length_4225_cov_1.670383_5_plen_51_part_01
MSAAWTALKSAERIDASLDHDDRPDMSAAAPAQPEQAGATRGTRTNINFKL